MGEVDMIAPKSMTLVALLLAGCAAAMAPEQ